MGGICMGVNLFAMFVRKIVRGVFGSMKEMMLCVQNVLSIIMSMRNLILYFVQISVETLYDLTYNVILFWVSNTMGALTNVKLRITFNAKL